MMRRNRRVTKLLFALMAITMTPLLVELIRVLSDRYRDDISWIWFHFRQRRRHARQARRAAMDRHPAGSKLNLPLTGV